MIIAIYKPVGPTSHDMIDKVRRVTREKKVGHAGTLDPLASGVLVVAIGRQSTKKLSQEVKKEKEYVASVLLGVSSSTDDEEGEKTEYSVKKPPDRGDIERCVGRFEGIVSQQPPVYSALKIKGRPAHQRVRAGEKIELEPRSVEIKEIEILRYSWPWLELRVVTGPGVYIRSLARDIGACLKTGGYLQKLERIRVGEYTKEETFTLEELAKKYDSK